MSGKRRASIDPSKAVCRTKFSNRAHLWDEDLDGNGQHRAETSEQRQKRHQRARHICLTCPQRDPCYVVGRSDPLARGIYGGVLIGPRR
ncbi:WhiB family transcription factor [Rhodococcus phage MacGully]|nr:WhiB family transcription factor [Rhodococcus phage MacGully]